MDTKTAKKQLTYATVLMVLFYQVIAWNLFVIVVSALKILTELFLTGDDLDPYFVRTYIPGFAVLYSVSLFIALGLY